MKQTQLVNDFDIDDFEDLEIGVFTLVNPQTSEPTSSTITLASKEHPARKKIDLQKTRKLRSAFLRSGGKGLNTDPLDDIEEETDYLVGVTLGWNLTKGGKSLEFTAQAARELYIDPKKQWIRAQVLDALNKNEVFIKASAKA